MDIRGDVHLPVFSIQEERLYSRCLFKQISVNELESDSYNILTVKLKLSILQGSNSLPDVRKGLEKEMEDFFRSSGAGAERQTVYRCCLIGCQFKARNHKN